MRFRIVNKNTNMNDEVSSEHNGHLLMHVSGEGRIMFVENISRKRMFAVGIYVRTSGSCEHSGESSIFRISWRCRRQPASLPPIEAGVLRARRARVTYEFKGFRETPARRARARARVHTVEVNSVPQTSLFEHSLRQDEDVQSFVAAQGLPLLPSLENLCAPSCLPRAVSSSHSLHLVLPPSSSRDLLCFLPFPPLVPPTVRFWRERDRQRARSGRWTRTKQIGRAKAGERIASAQARGT